MKINCKQQYYILVLLYRIVCDINYKCIIAKLFGYLMFFDKHNVFTIILSYVLLGLFTCLNFTFYSNQKNKISNEIVFFLFVMTVVPFTSLVGFGMLDIWYVVCNTFYLLGIFTWIKYLNRDNRVSFRIKESITYGLNDKVIYIITGLLFTIVLYVSWRYTHFRINFGFKDVYTFRTESLSYNMPTIMIYLYSWTRYSIAILTGYYLCKSKYFFAVACFIIQVLNFSIDGSKTTLVLECFVFVIFFMPKRKLANLNKYVLFGMISLGGVSLMWFVINGNFSIGSLFFRRTLYTPQILSSAYFDFFTKHAPDFYKNSFLRVLGFESEYQQLPNLISRLYFNADSNANNGLISDAMTNLGYIGIIVMPFVISLLFTVLDRVTLNLDYRIYVVSSLYITNALNNSFLLTVLFTHGLIVSIIILALMKRENYQERIIAIYKTS